MSSAGVEAIVVLLLAPPLAAYGVKRHRLGVLDAIIESTLLAIVVSMLLTSLARALFARLAPFLTRPAPRLRRTREIEGTFLTARAAAPGPTTPPRARKVAEADATASEVAPTNATRS